MRQLLDLATLIDARSVRPHPAALAVHRRRGPATGQGRVDHRRCTTRSPTGSTACACRSSTSTSTATPPTAAGARPPRDVESSAPPPTPVDRCRRSRPASSAASACRSASPSRCASCSPTRRASRRPSAAAVDTVRGAGLAALGHRRRAAHRCGRSARCAAVRNRAGAVPADQGRRQAARRDRSTPRSSPPPPRRPPATTSSSGARSTSLRASMAVSTRTEDSGANAFSVVAHARADGRDADRRAVRARSPRSPEAGAARRRPALDGRLATVATALPTSLMTRLARQQAQTVDFATSNVRSVARCPTYIAGAKMLENYAVGPLGGVAFNLTMISYVGNLDMGLNIDAAAVEDPARLANARRPRVPATCSTAGSTADAARTGAGQDRFGGDRREQRAHVEQQVGDLAADETSSRLHHLARAPGRSRRAPRRSRPRGTRWSASARAARSSHVPYRRRTAAPAGTLAATSFTTGSSSRSPAVWYAAMDLRDRTSSSPVRRGASAPPSPGASTPTGRASSWPTCSIRRRRRSARRRRRDRRRHLDRGRQRRADRAGRGGVRPDRPVLRQCRRRRRHRPEHVRGGLAARLRRQRQRPSLGRQAPARRLARRGHGYFCSTASAAGLLLQIGSAPYTVTKRAAVAFAEWLVDHLRRPGLRVSCLCPQGVNTDDAADAGSGAGPTWSRRQGGARTGRGRRASSSEAIAEERFLILPHPEVHDYDAAQGHRPRALAGRDAPAAGRRFASPIRAARPVPSPRVTVRHESPTHRQSTAPDVAVLRHAQRPATTDAPGSPSPRCRPTARASPSSWRRSTSTRTRPAAGSGSAVPTAIRPRSPPGPNDGQPAWSPDGRFLAFTSKRGEKEKEATLHVMPVDRPGRGAHARDDARGLRAAGVVARRQAGSRSPAAPATRYEAKDESWQPPRKIETFFTRLNGEGWIFDRPSTCTSSTPTAPGTPRNLTPGPHQHDGVSWLPDSSARRHVRPAPRQLGPRLRRRPVRRAARGRDPCAHQPDRQLRRAVGLPGRTAPSPSSASTTRRSTRRTPRSA